MNWIKIEKRLPEVGKLVYTKDAEGKIGAYTRTDEGWNSQVSTDNTPIVEWLEGNGPFTPLPMALLFHDLVNDYERYEKQGHHDTAVNVLRNLVEAIQQHIVEPAGSGAILKGSGLMLIMQEKPAPNCSSQQ
ncbi:hypothetical protein [Larkinella humicola]|uniref:Uncharacterized protein n=1 Tax=Larkinella humicola TaxID=2607654 RepID=A0A5N1JSD3_9BACT|nr:hypothetical protein [Larkinella humicola]KAA9357222.1 hypothetical protein F0P93_05660 [Larkinella humicola]